MTDFIVTKSIDLGSLKKETRVALSFLNSRHEYLASLDKEALGIEIKYEVSSVDDLEGFLSSPYNHLVDSIRFNNFGVDYQSLLLAKPLNGTALRKVVIVRLDAMEFDCSVIVDGVTSFHINNGQGVSCKGVLPGSVSNVSIIHDYENRDNRSDLVETMIKQLGSSVVSLDLPNQYKFTSATIIPSTVDDLKFSSTAASLKNLIVAQGKVYKNAAVVIQSQEDFESAKDLSWLGRITCYAVEPMTLTAGLLGSQINYIHIANLVGPLAVGVLPSALETLIVDYNEPLAADVLPASLKDLQLSLYNHAFTAGVLPQQLEKLEINSYNHQINKGDLPSTLTSLSIGSNHPLSAGVLPSKLQRLIMNSFNQPLEVNVIPSSVTYLGLSSFNQPITADIFPSTLQVLIFSGYKSTIPDNLKFTHLSCLSVNTLNAKIADTIQSGKIEIMFEKLEENIVLSDNIKDLSLIQIDYSEEEGSTYVPTIYKGLLPSKLESFTSEGLSLEAGAIPNSCIYVEIDKSEFEQDQLPQSVQIIKITVRTNVQEWVNKYSKITSIKTVSVGNIFYSL
ncbi:hypothetical protein CYY_010341 [Polysphondylium violaceum]|uniref:Uncharacterized protein n=1 Tax=Polysphondylium violaceum TaxID=133409 RepID=A0A8J4PJY6_9MYCE|nr:hypothetical protein CYY_010341 [Polysphondylium violaceum]